MDCFRPMPNLSPMSLSLSMSAYPMRKPRQFISPYLQDRMNQGKITPQELEKYFPFSGRELQAIKKGPLGSKGFLGVIVSLEDAIIDLREIYSFSYSFFAEAIGRKSSSDSQIYDIIGSTFKESLCSLGWDVDDTNNDYELQMLWNRFIEVFQFTLSKAPSIEAYPGAMELLDDIITEENELIVITSLPKHVAIKAIERAGLVNVFKGRVNPDHLISLFDRPFKTDDNEVQEGSVMPMLPLKQHIMRSCCMMEKNVFNSLYISANSRNILTAKRLGLNAVAVRGQALRVHDLRVADKVVGSLDELPMNDLYKIMCNSVMMAEGPGLQTAAVPVRLTAQSKQLAYDPIERPKAADGDDAKTIRRRLAPSTVPDDEYDFDEDNDKEIEDEDEEDSDDSDFEDMG